MIKRVLIDVYDKDGLAEFAKALCDMGFEIISSGDTLSFLKSNKIDVLDIYEVSKYPEIFGGKVKYSHPFICAGICADLENKEHINQLSEMGAEPIDMVVLDIQPIRTNLSRNLDEIDEIIKEIDCEKIALMRLAAANFNRVAVITNKSDYANIIKEINDNGKVSYETLFELAQKVFYITSKYDAQMHILLNGRLNCNEKKDDILLAFNKVKKLPCGENISQEAYLYKEPFGTHGTYIESELLNEGDGKTAEYVDILNTNSVLETLKDYGEEPTVVAAKSDNPVMISSSIHSIYDAVGKAIKYNSLSFKNSIIGLNRRIDSRTAEVITSLYVTGVIAPNYDEDALEILKKKDILIYELKDILRPIEGVKLKKILGGLIVLDRDISLMGENLKIVTDVKPTQADMNDMIFAWKAAKHLRSDAIVLAKDRVLVGQGSGGSNKAAAFKEAFSQCEKESVGCVLASDEGISSVNFVTAAHKLGIRGIIQPGGMETDDELIKYCNELGMPMIFTGLTHLKYS